MEKQVTARKEHYCIDCGKIIMPGESYRLFEFREPRFSEQPENPFEESDQIGIEFHRSRMCMTCIEETESMAKQAERIIKSKEYQDYLKWVEHAYP